MLVFSNNAFESNNSSILKNYSILAEMTAFISCTSYFVSLYNGD